MAATASLLTSAREDEAAVALILVNLKKLMSLSESLSGSNWGRRRKRSCLEPRPPSTSASSLPTPENRIEVTKYEEAAAAAAALEEKKRGRPTASPDTPLSFSPSASDEKPHSSKKRLRAKEEYMHMIEGLAKNNEVLTGKIESLKKLNDNLKASNSRLRSKKQEVVAVATTADRTAEELAIVANPEPSDDGVKPVNRGFDLNLVAEESFDDADEYQPLDLRREMCDQRARCAEARRKRIGIIRSRRVGLVKGKSKRSRLRVN